MGHIRQFWGQLESTGWADVHLTHWSELVYISDSGLTLCVIIFTLIFWSLLPLHYQVKCINSFIEVSFTKQVQM